MTDALGQSQVLPYLCGLSKAGFEISLLSCEKPAAFKKNRDVIAQLCQDGGIEWHPISYTKSPSVLSTIKDVFALRRAAFKLNKSKPFDIVHCRSYISALVGRVMRKKLGTKFLFDMRGFWADERIDGNLWRMSNPIHRLVYRFFKNREKDFFEQSDAIVSLTDAAKQEMLTWNFDIEPQKIKVIPCCADFSHFDFENVTSEQRKELRSQLGIESDALVLTYHGSTGTWYLVDEMLEFFALVLKQYPKSHLLFVTKDNFDQVRDKATRAGLPTNKITVTTASRIEIPALLSVTDVSYFFIKPSYSKMSSCPTKLGEILGMGKPVICNQGVGDIDTIFASGEIGNTLDVIDRTSWLQAVDSLARLLKLEPAEIRKKGLTLFRLETGIDAYCAIYKDLCQPRKPPETELINA